MEIERLNIGKVDTTRYNEALCRRFGVPEAERLVTPAVFTEAGSLVKSNITYSRLGDLLARASMAGLGDQLKIGTDEIAEAGEAISQRYQTLSLGVIFLAGLIDGINPCAFATIIFFLSYLQVMRRSPRDIMQIGLAFMTGVFVTYYALGLGLEP